MSKRSVGKVAGVSGRHIWIECKLTPEFAVGENVDITPYHEKRSLNANSYFHVLCDKLRQALNISFSACKNELITSYGQIEYIDDQQVVIKTNIPTEKMRESEVLHCRCVKADKEGETDVYFYRVYRGSHTYNSSEMAKLIDGTIRECQDQGIETLTPNELLRLEGYEKYSNQSK